MRLFFFQVQMRFSNTFLHSADSLSEDIQHSFLLYFLYELLSSYYQVVALIKHYLNMIGIDVVTVST